MIGFIAALSVGILAGLGIGSGGLFMMFLTLFEHTPQREAQAINLLFFVFALAGSVLVHGTSDRLPFRMLSLVLAAGIPGAIAGSVLAGIIHAVWLRRIFGAFLILSGILTLFKGGSSQKSRVKAKKKTKDA